MTRPSLALPARSSLVLLGLLCLPARAAYQASRPATDPTIDQRLDESRACARAGQVRCDLETAVTQLERAGQGAEGAVAEGVRAALDALRKDHGSGTSTDPAHYGQGLRLGLELARTARGSSDPGDQRMLVVGLSSVAQDLVEMPAEAGSAALAAETARAFGAEVQAILDAEPGNARFAGTMVLARYDLRLAHDVYRQEGGYTRTLALTEEALGAARGVEARRLALVARAEARAKGLVYGAEPDHIEAAAKVRADTTAALADTAPDQAEAVSWWAVLATGIELDHYLDKSDLLGHAALIAKVVDPRPEHDQDFAWPSRHAVALNHAAVAYAHLTRPEGVAAVGADRAEATARALRLAGTRAAKDALATCGASRMTTAEHALCSQAATDAELFATARSDVAGAERLRQLRAQLPDPVDPAPVPPPPLAPPPTRDGEDRIVAQVRLLQASTDWDVPGDSAERRFADRADVLDLSRELSLELDERTLGASATGDGHPAERADTLALLALSCAKSGDAAGAQLVAEQSAALDPAVHDRKVDGGRVPFAIRLDRLLGAGEAQVRRVVLWRPDEAEHLDVQTDGWEPGLAAQADRALAEGTSPWSVPERQAGGQWITFVVPADLPATLVVDGQEVALPDGPDAAVIELVDVHGDWLARPTPLSYLP